MELLIRFEKNDLCIDHQNGTVGFVVLTANDEQLDFTIDLKQWKQLKTFIDDSIWEDEQKKQNK